MKPRGTTIGKPAKYFVRPKPAVTVYPDGREVCQDSVAGQREYKTRTKKAAGRQHDKCALCGAFMHHDVTMDHQAGRGSGGSHRDDRIEVDGKWQNAAVHSRCNAEKGSKRYHWHDGKYAPKAPL